MENNNKTKMSDFLVTFFVDDQANFGMLSEVLKNRKDDLYLESLGLTRDLVIIFSQEEKNGEVFYTIKQRSDSKYKILLNGSPCFAQEIHNGDYYVFEHTSNNTTIKALFINTQNISIGYKKYNLQKNNSIFIGFSAENDISYSLNDIGSTGKNVEIRVEGNGRAFVENLKRDIPVYINGRLTNIQQLNLFDEIYFMGLSLIYMGDFIAVCKLNSDSKLLSISSYNYKNTINGDHEKEYFVSIPRVLKTLDNDEIEVDAPPNPFNVDSTPVLLTLGPSLTMSMVMLASLGVSITNAINGGEMSTIIASGTMAVGMLLGSLMWPSLLRRYQKKRTLSEEKNRKERYSKYISEIEKELLAKKNKTVRLLNDSLAPSPEILYSILDNESNKLRLWERSSEDPDFLDVRMGLGSRPFEVKLKIPKQGFQLYDDELRDLPVELSKKYQTMDDVPLSLDIRNNRAIAVIGDKDNMGVLLNEMVLNVISLHSYDEAKVVLITSPKQSFGLEVYKNVPHIWSSDKKVRYYATNSDEVHFIFNVIGEEIKDRENNQDKSTPHTPHYVIIVTEPELVAKEALVRYMNDSENQVGITTIFAYGVITKVPKSCKTIIQSDDACTGYYIRNKNLNKFIPFTLDNIERERVKTFARELSRLPIKRDSRSLGIADKISFLQMYKVGNVDALDIESHWDNNNSAKTLAAPIGVMYGGEIFNLDLHEAYHGCHGLVAGTTGSGKSEFLQSFILSLAINYSPKEVSFVLVDFKGGDMARPFMAKPFAPALPHLSATISNLSGNILYRALVSLEAEIRSRQRIFNESAIALGVDKLDINSYHKYYKGGRLNTPLPHLIIIIDEFAQLKTQHPEFLAQLINVAQVGRSLGIHLILATQKPSGVVDPQIMSNSRFKVCLKVADKQDSIDMINKPDSALIKNPGRMYLQVGYDEIYECVQSGYSGADYIPTKSYMPDEEITVHMTDNTANPIHSAKIDLTGNKSNRTQLEAIVSEIVALGQKKSIVAKPLWLDILPGKVVLSSLERTRKGLCTATIGLADFVRTQEQKPLTVDLAKSGHIGLYGASGTGKTTFLQTLVYSMVCDYGYTPEELNLYALDFGGRNLGYLSELPHTGGVVFADEDAKISELASTLCEIIDERKRIFEESNCGTFADYRMISKTPLPAVLVLIDNFASFRDRYMDISDRLVDIISSGKTFGVYFVITGNTRNSIYYKVAEHISSYFTLRMNDPSNYLDILNKRPPVTPENISGRGITVVNNEVVEFQTAIAFDGENEAERITEISRAYGELSFAWHGYIPVRLNNSENITENAVADTIYYPPAIKSTLPEALLEDSGSLIVGTSKTGASAYGISLSDDYKLCACARSLEDLSEFYKTLLSKISQHGDRRLVFIDDETGTFADIVNEYSDCRYIKGTSSFEEFIDILRPELNSRLETPEGQHEQMFIVISEFNRFFKMITDEQAAFMRKVLRYIDSPKYQICFICGFDVSGDKNNDSLFMSLAVNAENYVLCPYAYELALAKIETLPLITEAKIHSSYFCLREKNVEIRW